jgi:predicted RNA-binding protein with RPS1 domain
LVEAEITRLTNFGAFAKLRLENKAKDLEGLIHISEISEHRIEHPKEVIHVGDIVTLRIIKIEEDVHRIGLSLRRVDSPAYADLDWQALSKEIEITPSNEGEAIAVQIGSEQPETPVLQESPAVPEVTEVKKSAKVQESSEGKEVPEAPDAPKELETSEEPKA